MVFYRVKTLKLGQRKRNYNLQEQSVSAKQFVVLEKDLDLVKELGVSERIGF